MDSDTRKRKRKRENDSDSDLYYILHDWDLPSHVDLNYYKKGSNSAVLIMTILFIKNEIKNQMKLKN